MNNIFIVQIIEGRNFAWSTNLDHLKRVLENEEDYFAKAHFLSKEDLDSECDLSNYSQKNTAIVFYNGTVVNPHEIKE